MHCKSLNTVKNYFESSGLKTEEIPFSERPQFVTEIDGSKYIVETNDWKTKLVTLTVIQSFYYTLLSSSNQISGGLYITQKGFSETVKYFLKANQKKEIVLGLLSNNAEPKVDWLYPLDFTSKPKILQAIQIGVFTCKGGVGKTTVSFHLALMLSELGYRVALVDEDPENHLKRISKSALNKQSKNFVCLSSLEAAQNDALIHSYDFIIYDYPPSLKGQNIYSVCSIDYCLVPINLSPMSMGLDGEIIHKTFDYLSQMNPKAKLMALVNNDSSSVHPVSQALRRELQRSIKTYTKAHLLPCSIRSSQHLYYWGKGNVFSGIGKQSTAYEDFLSLSDYLINVFSLENQKQKSIFN